MSGRQRVLITAGGSGIGYAIADAFLQAGARVHLCDIDESKIAEASSVVGLTASLCDVADDHQVSTLFNAVQEQLGGLDVLVNNAGIGGGWAAVEDIEPEQWHRTLDVNLSGMFYCVRHAAPIMKMQRSGVILNISTASVRTGMVNRLPYIASKHGVEGITLNLARELGPFNIRCNAILPGLIDNNRGREVLASKAKLDGVSLEDAEAEYLNFISMRTWIDPREVGDLAVFLASDKAKHISGQFIAVDGHMEWEA